MPGEHYFLECSSVGLAFKKHPPKHRFSKLINILSCDIPYPPYTKAVLWEGVGTWRWIVRTRLRSHLGNMNAWLRGDGTAACERARSANVTGS